MFTSGKNPLMRDKRVLLLESAAERQYTQPETYSNRVSALSPASKKLLQGMFNTLVLTVKVLLAPQSLH